MVHRLAYAGFVDGAYTSLRDGALTRYLPEGPEKTDLTPGDVPSALGDIFGADPALYIEASEVRRRYGSAMQQRGRIRRRVRLHAPAPIAAARNLARARPRS